MTTRILLVFAALALLLGCGRDHDRQAAAGMVSAVSAPVGPLPGPGVEPAASTNPFRGDAAALVEGRKLFVRFNCAGCHGGRAGGGMGPSLRDRAWIYGDSDAHIFDSIIEGRAHGMPAWGARIPDTYVWKLVTYIRALGTDREPEAP